MIIAYPALLLVVFQAFYIDVVIIGLILLELWRRMDSVPARRKQPYLRAFVALLAAKVLAEIVMLFNPLLLAGVIANYLYSAVSIAVIVIYVLKWRPALVGRK